MQADLQTSGALLGFLAAAYFYPYALMQLPSGLLSDSWGPRKTITVFFALAGAASIFLGMVDSLGLAILARILVGLGVAMLFVPTMKVMTNWFKPEEFARMTGILMAVGGLAVAIWFLVRNTPQDKGLPAVNQPATSIPGKTAAIGLAQGMKMVLSSRSFWILAAWFFFSFCIFFSFGGLWGGPYLMHVYGLNKAEAGNILGMLALAMIVGSPSLSWLSDKVFRSRKKVIVLSSIITLGLTIPLAFFTDAMNQPALYLLCFLLGLFNSAVVVVAFTSAKELFPVEIAGTSVGLANLFPFLGGAVAPPILGAILEAQEKTAIGYSAHAYSRAFLLYFLFALIALGLACFITETMKKASD
jgi:sugar phosphate permease